MASFSSWTCELCTLCNEPEHLWCQACGLVQKHLRTPPVPPKPARLEPVDELLSAEFDEDPHADQLEELRRRLAEL